MASLSRSLLPHAISSGKGLRTLVVITDADGSLAAETVSPETTKVDLSLGNSSVGVQEPGTEDGLGEDVEDGIGDNFLVNIGNASTISDTPDDL